MFDTRRVMLLIGIAIMEKSHMVVVLSMYIELLCGTNLL